MHDPVRVTADRIGLAIRHIRVEADSRLTKREARQAADQHCNDGFSRGWTFDVASFNGSHAVVDCYYHRRHDMQ